MSSPFEAAALGTIVSIDTGDGFAVRRSFWMRTPDGWQPLADTGVAVGGRPRFQWLDAAPRSPAELEPHLPRTGLVLTGIAEGARLANAIQALALPDGAVVVSAVGNEYRKQGQDFVADAGVFAAWTMSDDPEFGARWDRTEPPPPAPRR